jgi:hypothetical protein
MPIPNAGRDVGEVNVTFSFLWRMAVP